MTTIQHGRLCDLRSQINAAETEGKSACFHAPVVDNVCPGLRGGGWGMAKSRNAAKPLSSICLILLGLSPVIRPDTLTTRESEKDGSDPPPNRGVMRPKVEARWGVPLFRPHGVAPVLIYPCGKAQKQPP